MSAHTHPIVIAFSNFHLIVTVLLKVLSLFTFVLHYRSISQCFHAHSNVNAFAKVIIVGTVKLALPTATIYDYAYVDIGVDPTNVCVILVKLISIICVTFFVIVNHTLHVYIIVLLILSTITESIAYPIIYVECCQLHLLAWHYC